MTQTPTQAPAAVDGLARVVTAATEALTDSMVERLAITGANVLEVADRLNDDETRDALLAAITALTNLHKMGAIDTLVEMVMMMHAVRTGIHDSMVERLAAFAEHMLNNLATEEVATLAHETKRALEDAIDEAQERPAKSGLFATLKLLSQPESMKTLQFMLNFGGNLRQRAQILARQDGGDMPQPG